MPKNKRWVCPKCNAGKLAPGKPRRDDVRRYCLPCSEATGRLVARVCPANDRQRAAAKLQRKTKAKRQRDTVQRQRQRLQEQRQANYVIDGQNPETLRREYLRLVGRMLREEMAPRQVVAEVKRAVKNCAIEIQHASRLGGSGYCYAPGGIVHVTTCPQRPRYSTLTLFHELTHVVCHYWPGSDKTSHGPRFKAILKFVACDYFDIPESEVNKAVAELRKKNRGRDWAYDIDRAIWKAYEQTNQKHEPKTEGKDHDNEN